MALIAKIFSADLGDENAKGNLLPQDLGAILGFLNPHDAGILNIPEKDCSQFGSINITGQTAIVTFHAGYIVIHGRLVYIEEGTEVAFNLPTSGSVNGVLGIKINLAESGANEVTWFQKTSGVVTEDLIKKETDGIYEFVLYNYTATDLSFTLGAKTTQIIDKAKDISETLLQQVFVTQPLNDKSNKVATTEFVKNSIKFVKPGDLTFRVTQIQVMDIKANKDVTNHFNEFNLEATGVIYTNALGEKLFIGNLRGEMPIITSGNAYIAQVVTFRFILGAGGIGYTNATVWNSGILAKSHFIDAKYDWTSAWDWRGLDKNDAIMRGIERDVEGAESALCYFRPEFTDWRRTEYKTALKIYNCIIRID